jgi:hypothetical protein
MDTCVVQIADTLKTMALNGGDTWPTSTEIALIGMVFSILAFGISFAWSLWAFRNMKQREINDKWAEMAAKRIRLWKILEKEYKNWPNSTPKKFDDLISGAAIPEGILEREQIDTVIKQLSGEPKKLYDFCLNIHQNQGADQKLKAKGIIHYVYDYDKFREESSQIIWYLNGWAETTDKDDLCQRFKYDRHLFILLTWLELALKEVICSSWSDRTKFFELAYAIDKEGRK